MVVEVPGCCSCSKRHVASLLFFRCFYIYARFRLLLLLLLLRAAAAAAGAAVCNTLQVRFGGAIDKPMEMSVEYIKANFKEITIPVTLVCAGNRRKEENMIKQGLG